MKTQERPLQTHTATDQELMRQCRNCSHEFAGNYCPECGQKVIEGRFTVKRAVSEFFSNIFNLESGFLHTAWRLIVSPGKVIDEYLNGKTRCYYNPFRFLIVIAGVSIILSTSLGIMDMIGSQFDAINQQQAASTDPVALEFQRQWLPFVMGALPRVMSILPLMMLPVLAFPVYLAYKSVDGVRLNYAEHTVIAAFTFGEASLLGILNFAAMPFLNEYSYVAAMTLPLVTMLAYFVYVYVSYSMRKGANGFLTGTLSFFSFGVGYFLGIAILVLAMLAYFLVFVLDTEAMKAAAEAAKAAKAASGK